MADPTPKYRLLKKLVLISMATDEYHRRQQGPPLEPVLFYIPDPSHEHSVNSSPDIIRMIKGGCEMGRACNTHGREEKRIRSNPKERVNRKTET
jgi:hypothetical protein